MFQLFPRFKLGLFWNEVNLDVKLLKHVQAWVLAFVDCIQLEGFFYLNSDFQTCTARQVKIKLFTTCMTGAKLVAFT